MSLSAPSPDTHPGPSPDQAAHDVTIAWVAVAAMIAMLAAIPVIGSTEPETSFTVGALILGAFTVLLAAIGTIAWRYGFRARDEGRGSGVLAAAIGAAIGGMFALLFVAVLLARLFGFE
jgi:tetrahydromethanopterin S-methyltransferase subunit F